MTEGWAYRYAWVLLGAVWLCVVGVALGNWFNLNAVITTYPLAVVYCALTIDWVRGDWHDEDV